MLNAVLAQIGYKIVRALPGETSARGHITDFIHKNPQLFKGSILDIGSGGWLLLKQMYPHVTTFDIKPPADLIGDVHHLTDHVRSASFDTVGAFELLEHVSDPRKVIEQVYEVLKPGGIFVGATPFLYPLHGEDYGDYWRFTRQGWQLLLSDFEDVQIVWNGDALMPSHYIVTARKPF